LKDGLVEISSDQLDVINALNESPVTPGIEISIGRSVGWICTKFA